MAANLFFQLFIWVYLILFAVTGQLATAGNDTESIESRSGKGNLYYTEKKFCLGNYSYKFTKSIFFCFKCNGYLFFLQLCLFFKLFGA